MSEGFELIQGGVTGDADQDAANAMRNALGPLADKAVWNLSNEWFRTHFDIPDDSELWAKQNADDIAHGREMKRYQLDFGSLSDQVKTEAMLYFAIRIADPRRRTLDWFTRAKNMLNWLAEFDRWHPRRRLREMTADEMRDGFDAYLQANGTERKPLTQQYIRRGEVVEKEYRDPSSMPANDLYYVLRLFREGLKPLHERDWVLADQLGFAELPPRARADHLLKFDNLTTDWYRAAVRQYFTTKSLDRQFSWSTIRHVLSTLEVFHRFLIEKLGRPAPGDVTKKLIVEDFKGWGIEQKFAGYQWFSDVTVFLHHCMDRDVHGLPKFIVTPDHFPRARKSARQYLADAPERAISAEVLAAIIDHIEELPSWVRRLFILGRYTAYRRTDLHSCPFSLLQPDDGTFMQLIRYHSKTDSVTRQLVKIDDDVGQLIIKTVTDQQKEAQAEFGFQPDYLFPSARTGDAKPTHRWPGESADYINKLLIRHKVADPKTGTQASFNWHSLRHHRGTELALQGFDIIFIQTELGHSTPNMTMHYIGARNALKKKAFAEKGGGYFINIYGDIVVPRTDPDHELRKQQITATWTNGGRCGLPSQVGEWCEHADACFGCRWFEADSESEDYFETREVNLDLTVQAQEIKVTELEGQGNLRMAEIERRRLDRNRSAQTGCRNILKTIRENGAYRGSESKYRKPSD